MRTVIVPLFVMGVLGMTELLGGRETSPSVNDFTETAAVAVASKPKKAAPKGKAAKKTKAQLGKKHRHVRAAIKHLGAARKQTAKAKSLSPAQRAAAIADINAAIGKLRAAPASSPPKKSAPRKKQTSGEQSAASTIC